MYSKVYINISVYAGILSSFHPALACSYNFLNLVSAKQWQ